MPNQVQLRQSSGTSNPSLNTPAQNARMRFRLPLFDEISLMKIRNSNMFDGMDAIQSVSLHSERTATHS